MPWTAVSGKGQMPTTEANLPTTLNHFDWAGVPHFTGLDVTCRLRALRDIFNGG